MIRCSGQDQAPIFIYVVSCLNGTVVMKLLFSICWKQDVQEDLAIPMEGGSTGNLAAASCARVYYHSVGKLCLGARGWEWDKRP